MEDNRAQDDQIGAEIFGGHPTQVGGWKKQALAGLPDVFGNGREQMHQQADAVASKDEHYKQIGQLKVELDFLKTYRLRAAAHMDRSPTSAVDDTTAVIQQMEPARYYLSKGYCQENNLHLRSMKGGAYAEPPLL